MSTFPFTLPPQRFDQLRRRSRHVFHWRARETDIFPLTPQSLVLARPSTAPSMDSEGGAFTAAVNEPAWVKVDGRVFLRLNHGAEREDFRCSFRVPPSMGLVGYMELIDRGTAGDAVLHIGAGSTDTSSLTIRQTAGGAWEAAIRTAGGLSTSTVASPTTESGDRVRLYWILTPTGGLQLQLRKNDEDWIAGGEVSGLTLPAAWQEPEIRMGFITAGGSGRIDLRTMKLVAYRPPPDVGGV